VIDQNLISLSLSHVIIDNFMIMIKSYILSYILGICNIISIKFYHSSS